MKITALSYPELNVFEFLKLYARLSIYSHYVQHLGFSTVFLFTSLLLSFNILVFHLSLPALYLPDM